MIRYISGRTQNCIYYGFHLNNVQNSLCFSLRNKSPIFVHIFKNHVIYNLSNEIIGYVSDTLIDLNYFDN